MFDPSTMLPNGYTLPDTLIDDTHEDTEPAFEDLIDPAAVGSNEVIPDEMKEFMTPEMNRPQGSRWTLMKKVDSGTVVEPKSSEVNFKFLVTRYMENGKQVYELSLGDWFELCISRFGKVYTEILNFVLSLRKDDILKIRLGYDGWGFADMLEWNSTLFGILSFSQAKIVTCLDTCMCPGETCMFVMGEDFLVNPLGQIKFSCEYRRYLQYIPDYEEHLYRLFEKMAVDKGILLEDELAYIRSKKCTITVPGYELIERLKGHQTSQVPVPPTEPEPEETPAETND